MAIFGVIGGKILEILEPRQVINQNDALGHVITKKWFSISLDPKLGVFGVIGGQNLKISVNYIPNYWGVVIRPETCVAI